MLAALEGRETLIHEIFGSLRLKVKVKSGGKIKGSDFNTSIQVCGVREKRTDNIWLAAEGPLGLSHNAKELT
ncbi:hypothetical protein C5167_011891 [Papaver somniferum]|uniref:Uncharacterized protein n=1 Tax=Papaver somniferum TaxID=3469 RepID=A0A4Y7IWL2_PAPSO|nr:hypothetical protein C5167_011891 [Papaver somniferum]